MKILNELKELGWSDELISAAEAVSAKLEGQGCVGTIQTNMPPIESKPLYATHTFMVKSDMPVSISYYNING